MTQPNTLASIRSSLRVCLMLCVTTLLTLSSQAQANVLSDRLEFGMYGRMGAGWTPTSGRIVAGQTFNLTGSALGGRLEEGDYLEPTLKVHLLERNTDPNAAYVDAVLTPSLFTTKGSFLGLLSSGDIANVSFQLFQAYLEAGNVGLPGLRVWGGSRFYRGTDVHIADYFYFNNLSGQGGGVAYGPLDVAVLLQTSGGPNDQYNDTVGTASFRRQRTVFVAQYVHKFESGNSLHGLAEFHLLPSSKVLVDGVQTGLRSDHGWALGVKNHLDIGNGSFNDTSVRYGARIANGGQGNSQDWSTFGFQDRTQTMDGAYGLEVVDHFLYNFGPLFSLNAYGILHMNQGQASLVNLPAGTKQKEWTDFAVGARGVIYLHDNFHLIAEASFQGLKQEITDLATAVKLSIAPTFVPFGGRSVWARPHFRIFYTLALYDQNAVDQAKKGQVYSGYLATVGATSVGHFIGTRVEWWF